MVAVAAVYFSETYLLNSAALHQFAVGFLAFLACFAYKLWFGPAFEQFQQALLGYDRVLVFKFLHEGFAFDWLLLLCSGRVKFHLIMGNKLIVLFIFLGIKLK